MTALEYERPTRRAQVPKRQPTPGARLVPLTRIVDYGGDVGEVEEKYAEQLVVDCFPPGSDAPVTVTEKAFHYVYQPKGYSLEPGQSDPAGSDARRVADVDVQRLEDVLAEAATEREEERLAREAAEARARAVERELKAERDAGAARDAELAELRAKLEAMEPAGSGASESAKAGGKAK